MNASGTLRGLLAMLLLLLLLLFLFLAVCSYFIYILKYILHAVKANVCMCIVQKNNNNNQQQNSHT